MLSSGTTCRGRDRMIVGLHWGSVPRPTAVDMLGLLFMVFNATFNNISVILRQSILLVKETGVPRENH
jgi:hypothetical protein